MLNTFVQLCGAVDLPEFRPAQLLHDEIKSKVKELALDGLISYFPVSFYWMDRDGFLLGCNARVLDSLGLDSVDEFVGKHSTELVTKAAWENSLQVLGSGQPVTFEETQVQGDGQKTTYISVKSPIFDSSQQVIGLLGISLDITERKQLEQKLYQAKDNAEKANRIKSEVIQNMEHDLRTPLSGVIGTLEYLKENEKQIEKREFIEEAYKASSELLEFLDRFLEFSHIESGDFSVVIKHLNIARLVDKVIAMEKPAARKKKLQLEARLANNLPKIILSDAFRIERILVNLISNALKFTESGRVRVFASISAEIKPGREVVLRLCVEDTGPGIPIEKQTFVYTKLSRLEQSNKGRHKGPGLGLSIVKQFVNELDGDIRIESQLNQGTRFSFDIPVKIPYSE